MLNKFAFCIVIFTLSVSSIFAQTDNADEEINNFEVYGGATLTKDYTNSFNPNVYGIEGAYVKNVNRFVGIKADANVSFNTTEFSFVTVNNNGDPQLQTVKTKSTDYNFLGGIQIKDNRKEGSRLRPFAHALVGIGVNNRNFDFSNVSTCSQQQAQCPNLSETNVGFSSSFGGGLDIKVNDKISLRAIQVDYNPRRFSELGFQNNVRFGAGIVFH